MIVVQVITRLIVGGAQLSVLRLSEALVQAGYDVRIVTGPQEGPEGSLRAQAAAIAPVTVVPALVREIDPLQDLRAVGALRRLFGRLRPALIHTHSSKAGIVGRLAAPRGPALVHTVHGWGHTPGDPAARRDALVRAERLAARRTDALITVSESVRAEGERLGIGRPEQYRVIPEFVDYRPVDPDFAKARARARERLGLAGDTEVFGWVGRFVEQKDPETVGAVLAAALGARPAARAVLVGDGPLRPLVARALAPFGERVLFTGLRTDARELYAAFDVLLHPSLWEGQPRVIQEALAERVPVVASRVIGTEGLLTGGVTGVEVAPRDVRGFVDGLLRGPRAPLPAEAIAGLAASNGIPRASAAHLELFESLL